MEIFGTLVSLKFLQRVSLPADAAVSYDNEPAVGIVQLSKVDLQTLLDTYNADVNQECESSRDVDDMCNGGLVLCI